MKEHADGSVVTVKTAPVVCHSFRLDAEANLLSTKRIIPDTETRAISDDHR